MSAEFYAGLLRVKRTLLYIIIPTSFFVLAEFYAGLLRVKRTLLYYTYVFLRVG